MSGLKSSESVDNTSPKIHEESIPNIDIYPNPADKYISLLLFLEKENEIIFEIYNMNGELKSISQHVYQAGLNKEDIDISEIERGIYLIRITGLEFVETKKLIIQ